MPTPQAPAIRCSSITKNYGMGDTQVQALRGIDLDVHPGELLMLVGPSGCGKTTLISIIAGILDQTHGDCHLFGQNLRDLSQEERTRYRGQNIGFGLGAGITSLFALKGSGGDLSMTLNWQLLLGSGSAVLVIVLLAALLSIRKVMKLEPAIVFKG